MRDFVFESRTKTLTYVLMGIGVLSLGWTWFSNDPLHMRFWGNWLHNAVFFTGIAVVAMFFMSAQIVGFSGWNALVRRLWEAQSMFIVVGIALFLPLIAGLFGHWHHLYHWNVEGVTDPASPNYDKIIAGKSGFVNKYFYTLATCLFLGAYYWIARRVRQHSIEQDEVGNSSFTQYKRIRTLSAIFLPVFGFTSIVLTWQWMMSLDAHWYSTMFGWYSWASLFLAMISFTILLTIWLKSKGYLQEVTQDHLHDLGKYMFAITVFWTYTWYDQYMLIWYANIGEETVYFRERWYNYPLLHGGNLVLNFVLPFLILMRNDTKRKYGTLVFVGCLVFLGHWWDYFQQVKPSTRKTVIEHMQHEEHGAMGEAKHHEMGESHMAEAAKEAGHDMKEAGDKMVETAAKTEAGQAVQHAAEKAGEAADKMAEQAGHPVEAEPHPAAEAHPAEAAAEHGEHGEHGEGHEAALEPDGPKPFALGWSFPGFLEFGTMLGFLGLFLYVVLSQLEKAALKPRNDAWMEESEHHHVV